eukprot:g3732.t1
MSTSSSSSEAAMKAMKKINKKLSKRGEKLLKEKLPEMVLAAAKLCEDPLFSMHIPHEDDAFKLDEVTKNAIKVGSVAHSAKRRKIARGEDDENLNGNLVNNMKPELPVVPSNKKLLRMMETLKVHYTESMEVLSTMKMWIQLNIPKIQDGNNFAVGVQEECITELSRVEDSCFTVIESMSKYFGTRASLVAKAIKYPTVADYRRSIEEVDHMEAINLKMCCVDLRNNFAILHDTLIKNIDKLMQTKGGGQASINMMY